MKNEWIQTSAALPELNEIVWAYNEDDNYIMLGCRVLYDDNWFWARSDGYIYIEAGKIVSECKLDDDYSITHWCRLPEVPKTYYRVSKEDWDQFVHPERPPLPNFPKGGIIHNKDIR